MPHLLIIDDDERLRSLLGKYLTQAGFQTTLAENPTQAEELLKLFVFDGLIMDVMMPFKNGIEYTKELKDRGMETPILMLTAMGETSQRISGLESGADDYLVKPFDPKELLLRIKNLLKHTQANQEIISFGPYQYDLQKKCLTKDASPVSLTTIQQKLLDELVKSPNKGVGREKLAQAIHTELERTVDVQIKRLRQQIEPDPKHPIWIQTVRGKGYKLIRI